jgi:hypothetical protein
MFAGDSSFGAESIEIMDSMIVSTCIMPHNILISKLMKKCPVPKLKISARIRNESRE